MCKIFGNNLLEIAVASDMKTISNVKYLKSADKNNSKYAKYF